MTVSAVYEDLRKPTLPYAITVRHGRTESISEIHPFPSPMMAQEASAIDPGARLGLESMAIASPAVKDKARRSSASALRNEQRPGCAVDQGRSETLTGIIGARRACTVSMISPLSMPWR